MLNDTEAETGRAELRGAACQLIDGWAPLINCSLSSMSDAGRGGGNKDAEGRKRSQKLESRLKSLGSRLAEVRAAVSSFQQVTKTVPASVPLPANEECSNSAEISGSWRTMCNNNWKVLGTNKYSIDAEIVDWEK